MLFSTSLALSKTDEEVGQSVESYIEEVAEDDWPAYCAEQLSLQSQFAE